MQRSTYVGSDRNVLARIAAQQQADETAAYLKETRTRQAEATWVSKSGEVQSRVSQRERSAAERAEAEAALNARRQRLAEKLAVEAESYRAELAAQATTPEQRRAALEARALDLFARREAERAALALEAQYRAWRAGAGTQDLRDADAVAAARGTAAEQLRQAEAKAAAVRARETEEQRFAAMNLAEKERKEARHVADVAAQREKAEVAKAGREAQLRELASRRGADAAAKAAEVRRLHALWAAEDAAAAAAQQARTEAEIKRQQEVLAFNTAKKAADAGIAAREKALDAALAAGATARAAEAQAAELAAREAKRQGDAAYRQCLAEQRIRELESDAEREAMMAAYNAAVAAAQDAQWAREASARAALQADVIANNDAQLAAKAAARVAAAEMSAQERREAEAAFHEANAARLAGKHAHVAAMAARRDEIEAQVARRVAIAGAEAEAYAAQDRARAAAEAKQEAILRDLEAARSRKPRLSGGRIEVQRVDPAAMPAAGVRK